MSRKIVFAAAVLLFASPCANADPVEAAGRCGDMVEALSKRQAGKASVIMLETPGLSKTDEATQVALQRLMAVQLDYIFEKMGEVLDRRELLSDAPVTGSDALVHREVWIFFGDRRVQLACVRYQDTEGGWATRFQFGSDMEALVTFLGQKAQQRLPASEP